MHHDPEKTRKSFAITTFTVTRSSIDSNGIMFDVRP